MVAQLIFMVGIDTSGIVAATFEKFLKAFVPDTLDQFLAFPLNAALESIIVATCTICNSCSAI